MLSDDKESADSIGDKVPDVKVSAELSDLLPSKDKGMEA